MAGQLPSCSSLHTALEAPHCRSSPSPATPIGGLRHTGPLPCAALPPFRRLQVAISISSVLKDLRKHHDFCGVSLLLRSAIKFLPSIPTLSFKVGFLNWPDKALPTTIVYQIFCTSSLLVYWCDLADPKPRISLTSSNLHH